MIGDLGCELLAISLWPCICTLSVWPCQCVYCTACGHVYVQWLFGPVNVYCTACGHVYVHWLFGPVNVYCTACCHVYVHCPFGPVSVCTVLPVAMYMYSGSLALSMCTVLPVAMYIHTGCLVLSMYVLYSQPVAVCMCALSVWISVHSLAVCTLFDHLCVYNVPVLTLCILFRSRCIVWLCVYCGPALSVMFGPVIWPCLYCLAL